MKKNQFLIVVSLVLPLLSCNSKKELFGNKTDNTIEEQPVETVIENQSSGCINQKYPEYDKTQKVESTLVYDINVQDDAVLAKEKLIDKGKKVSDGTDYAGVYKIWNTDMILEENINMDFMICFYKNKLTSVTKFNMNLEECNNILSHYSIGYDLSALKNNTQIVFSFENWSLEFYRYDNCFIYEIRNEILAEEVQEVYMEYQKKCDDEAERLEQ